MKIDKRIERKKEEEVVTALICPDCGGTNIVWQGGYVTGQKYHCVDCHYRGAFILERKVIVQEDDEVQEL